MLPKLSWALEQAAQQPVARGELEGAVPARCLRTERVLEYPACAVPQARVVRREDGGPAEARAADRVNVSEWPGLLFLSGLTGRGP